MPTVSLEEAQAKLPERIDHLQPGEEVIITRDQKPVARLTGIIVPTKAQRKLGTMKGSILYMAPDFDAPLDDFKEYMPPLYRPKVSGPRLEGKRGDLRSSSGGVRRPAPSATEIRFLHSGQGGC